jgi:DNA polymerase
VVTILFYDFEVFKYNWLVVCLDTDKRQETVIVDDGNALENFHQEHIRDIWVGFNNRHYDQYILKGILCGFDPKKVNDYIIVRGDPGWQFSSEFRRIPLINYDVMLTNDRGLKAFEGFMGDNIKESSVPFDVDRPLTKEEIEETIKYCRYDVHKTMEIFMLRQEEFNASRELIKIFGLPITSFSKTKAQIVAEICGGMRKKFDDNEFEFPIVPCLKLDKYKYILDWYKNPENFDYEKSLETVVTGVPHTFSWGGVHGAKSKNYEEGILLIVDVTAYYPSIQLEYKYGYRNMAKPENFELIHNQNLKYKNEGNKQARLPFKIADNSISGQLKDKNSSLFDPQMNNAVCVNGQLMLLMLIEMLEPHIKKLIQSNTDGLLIELNTIDDYDVVDDIVFEWERLTGMKMEFELFNKVFQKDVNNYILIGDDGKIKRKGSYVKKLSSIDYDLPIINRALVDYMVHGTPVEETINGCDDLKEFQLVTKISNKYTHILHGAERIKEKCIRVFASVIKSDAGVQKVHAKTGKAAKMANSPLHCFIYNEEVNGIKCPVRLDKQWYIDLANKRLGDFGVI